MDNEKDIVLSNIYLKAVLPLLEDIVRFDEEAKKLTAGWKCSIMFHVGNGGPATTLVFRNGNCEALRKKVTLPSIAMYFSQPSSVNRMFEGENVMPIIWTGLWHPIVLKNFIALTKRIEYYMDPADEVVKDPAAFPKIVELMLYAAVHGACQVAEHDSHVKTIAGSTPEATLQIRILPDGPAAGITKSGGTFTAFKGEAGDEPDAVMEIKDIELAYALFKGEVDAMAALGCCDIRIKGLVPFVDNVNAFLDRLGVYLDT